MNAFIFTRDKVTGEVLAQMVDAIGFRRVQQVEPGARSAARLPDDDSAVAFVDFDLDDVTKTTLNLPVGVVVIPFGRHEVRDSVPESTAAFFLAKPFDRDQVEQVARRALLKANDLPSPDPPPAPGVAPVD